MRRINRVLVAGIACLSLGQAWAQQDDGVPRVTDPSIPLSYVGNNGSISIGVNSQGESEGKLTGVFARNDERAFIEQLWWDRSGAGGIQSDYNWLWGMSALEARQNPDQATVARFSFAVDQNGEHARKATVGFGIERRAFSIEGYVARGISGARTDRIDLVSSAASINGADELGSYTQMETTSVETVFASKPFNSEVGVQVSHFFEPLSMRVHGGASVQNGDGARSNTLSVGFDSPLGKSGWGVAALAEHVNNSGGIDAEDDDRFSIFLRYEFGRHGSFVPTSELNGPAWVARSLGRQSTAHPRTVQTYRVRGSQTTTVTRSPKEYTNLFPLAQVDTATTSAGVAVTIDVLANDTDPDGGVLSLTSVTAPANGSALISNSRIIYTPAAGFVGLDNFQYFVSDGQGGSGSARVSVSVGAQINVAPIIRDDSASTPFEQPITINVLANDSDADGDVLSVIAITTPAHGSVLLAGNVVTYTPDPGFSGADSFTYTASDGRGGQGTATVRVTVDLAANAAPIANNDSATTSGLPIAIYVLANDSDPDGDPLTIISVTTPINGGLAVISGNAVTYTPPTAFVGSDRFAYTISDGNGGSATAMVTINVAATINQPPVAVPDAYTILGGALVLVMPVLGNDSDPDGDPLTIVSVTQPSPGSGTVTIDGSGQTITFNRQTTLPATFTYTISDGRGGTATTNVTVTLSTPINQPPVAVPDAYTIPATSLVLVMQVLANDSDPDGDPLTIVSVTQPPTGSGSVTIDGSGQTITFNRQTVLPATFTYTISDGRGGTASTSVTVTLGTVINQPPVAVDDSFTVTGPTLLQVLMNDSDPDGDPLTIISVTQPLDSAGSQMGSVAIDGSGQAVMFSFSSPIPPGVLTFTYTISDGQGGTATATVTLVF